MARPHVARGMGAVAVALAIVALPAVLAAAPAGAATGPVLHLTASAPPAVIAPSGSGSSTVTASNTGDAPTLASTVTISYTRSTSGGLSVAFTAGTGITCSIYTPRYGSKRATCTVPPLAPGAKRAVAAVAVTAPASVPYSGLNASLYAVGPTDTASAAFKVRGSGPANLTAAVYATPTTSLVNRSATATVTIRDLGYSPANAFTTTITLPAGTTGIVATAPAGTACTTASTVVSCVTTTLANGATLPISVDLVTPNLATAGAVQVATDTTLAVPETSESDNTASAALDIRAVAAALQVSVVNPSAVPEGTLFTRTVTVTNIGGGPATAVTLADRFTQFLFVRSSGPVDASCSQATSYSGKPPKLHKIGANCALGDFAPGQAKTVTLTLSAAGNLAAGTYTDSARASTTAYTDPLVNPSTTGSTTVVVPTTVAAPTNTVLPVVTGNLNTGSVLTATAGTWISYGTPTLAYAWRRCPAVGSCTAIPGATASTYAVQAADVGFRLVAVVTATNAGGSTPAASAAVGPAIGSTAPTIAVAPALLPGLEKQPGFAWGVSTGTWNGTPTITYAYQWYRCAIGGASCAPISGATTASYLLTLADAEHTVKVLVTATNTAGTGTAWSNLSPTIDPPDTGA